MVKTFAIACLAFIITGNVYASGNPAAGKKKTAVCSACHGKAGVSSNPIWPNLAGQNAEYITKELHDFKAKRRTNPQMSPMAMTLSDSDIADVAAYYASLDRAVGKASPKDLDAGQTLYRAGNPKTGVVACTACHGPDGAGNPAAKYPALGGQHAQYVESTLKAFRAGTRANDNNSIMRTVTHRMTDKEIQEVANYIQGLH